jgi:hypothetical protein
MLSTNNLLSYLTVLENKRIPKKRAFAGMASGAKNPTASVASGDTLREVFAYYILGRPEKPVASHDHQSGADSGL